MTAIAEMPDGAAGDGIADDTAEVQGAFDRVAQGGLVIIPDGVFRVTSTIHAIGPISVWCSPGAHIKGDFSGTDAVVWSYWHTPDGTSGLYAQQQCLYWQGGTISRLNQNGPCLRISSTRTGAVENVRTIRGSPHIVLDAPDTVDGWYKGSADPEWMGPTRVAFCRGYDGGPAGLDIGKAGITARGEVNRIMVEGCYFEGNGGAGGYGLRYEGGYGVSFQCLTLKNYAAGLRITDDCGGGTTLGVKMITVPVAVVGGSSPNRMSFIHPRGSWTSDPSSGTWAGRDAAGEYLAES